MANWSVTYSNKAAKQRNKLPFKVKLLADRLLKEMELNGPICKDWKNFGKLVGETYHCHLKKGKPTYVACWKIQSKEHKRIEVYYVGTHENAPY